jgi:hypothetical protein
MVHFLLLPYNAIPTVTHISMQSLYVHFAGQNHDGPLLLGARSSGYKTFVRHLSDLPKP